jgi:iron complex outermembrane receptor protein
VEAVLNVPMGDSFRVRLGLDHDERDGYQKNIGFPTKYGKDMGSVDYWTFRASAVIEPAPNFEHYILGYYTDSKSSGTLPAIDRCFDVRNGVRVESTPGVGDGMSSSRAASFFPAGQRACDQIARENAAGGFWTVSNANPDAGSTMKQWQIINRSEWQVSDAITITNIFSYAEHRSNNSVSAFGDYGPLVTPVVGPEDVYEYVGIQDDPKWGWTSAESSLIEELRFSGNVGGRLDWQAGLYYELNRPIGRAGQQQGLFTS